MLYTYTVPPIDSPYPLEYFLLPERRLMHTMTFSHILLNELWNCVYWFITNEPNIEIHSITIHVDPKWGYIGYVNYEQIEAKE